MASGDVVVSLTDVGAGPMTLLFDTTSSGEPIDVTTDNATAFTAKLGGTYTLANGFRYNFEIDVSGTPSSINTGVLNTNPFDPTKTYDLLIKEH